MPVVDPASYSSRALAQAVAALRTSFEGGDYARFVDVGVTTQKTPTNIASGSLFSITGGRVQIVQLEGRVTTQIQAASRTLKFVYSPTTALGDTDLCAVSADITGLAVGKKLVPTGALAAALSISNFEFSLRQTAQWILEPGLIKLASSSTAITGVVAWTINWKPVDAAGVLAAA